MGSLAADTQDLDNSVRPLRALLIALCIVPSVLFLLVAWFVYESHFEQARGRLDRTLELIHQHATKVFETNALVTNHVDRILAGLSDDEIRQQERQLHHALTNLKLSVSQLMGVWILDRNGFPLLVANKYPAPSHVDLSDRSYFQVHRADPRPNRIFVSEVLKGRVFDQSFIQVSTARFSDDGVFAGVTAISLSPDYFESFYPRLKESPQFSAALIRKDGAVLARYPEVPQEGHVIPPATPVMKAIAEAPERGLWRGLSPHDGVDRLIAHQRLEGYPLYVTAGISVGDIRAAWLREISTYFMFGFPATLALILLTVHSMRRARQEAQAHAKLRSEVARRQATEDQLRQASKMEAIGRLTGGIAHDFNNLLTAIGGNVEALHRRLSPDDKKLQSYAERARLGIDRAAKLTQHLLAFSRQQPLKPRPVDLNKLITGISYLLQQSLGANIDIETTLQGGLWRVLADANQLENVVINLAVNGRDAMPAGGRLSIETANASVAPGERKFRTGDEIAPGDYVMLAVHDRGTGMPPEVAEKAFDPFFTTKPQGQGTGLGLSQVYGFVKQSGGHIEIDTAEGRGTTIRILLPRHQEAAGEPDIPVAFADIEDSETRGGRETILLVEDDAEVRRYAAEVLKELGYRVLEAGDGQEALESDVEAIDLLLTDVVLPGAMNGREIADAVQSRKPGVKVLFTTGYARTAIIHDGRVDADVRLLRKPFTHRELMIKVRQVLDEPGQEAGLPRRESGSRT